MKEPWGEPREEPGEWEVSLGVALGRSLVRSPGVGGESGGSPGRSGSGETWQAVVPAPLQVYGRQVQAARAAQHEQPLGQLLVHQLPLHRQLGGAREKAPQHGVQAACKTSGQGEVVRGSSRGQPGLCLTENPSRPRIHVVRFCGFQGPRGSCLRGAGTRWGPGTDRQCGGAGLRAQGDPGPEPGSPEERQRAHGGVWPSAGATFP